jgi:hypothetical protein
LLVYIVLRRLAVKAVSRRLGVTVALICGFLADLPGDICFRQAIVL